MLTFSDFLFSLGRFVFGGGQPAVRVGSSTGGGGAGGGIFGAASTTSPFAFGTASTPAQQAPAPASSAPFTWGSSATGTVTPFLSRSDWIS